MGDENSLEDDSFAVFTNVTTDGSLLRPHNWPMRLADIAAAHWRGRAGRPECDPCYQCPQCYCFTVSKRLLTTEPALARDLLRFVRMVGAVQVAKGCPRFTEPSESGRPEGSPETPYAAA
ncbi:MAG: hypothetical protein WCC36_01745 [Gammaproteobacteria bacterium]